MIDTAESRTFIVVFLLIAHIALFPFFAQQPANPEAGVFPTEDEFIESPDQYLGNRIVTSGIVQEATPLVIEVETTQGRHQVTITGSDLSSDVGDKVRVYGILSEPRKIQTINAFVVPPGRLWYTWTVSFFAGLWVLLRLIKHWKINISTLSFHRRESPLPSTLDLFFSNSLQGGDRDA